MYRYTMSVVKESKMAILQDKMGISVTRREMEANLGQLAFANQRANRRILPLQRARTRMTVDCTFNVSH